MHARESVSIWHQPKAVWAVAFTCVVAFMGIGLVDPILPAIAKGLHAGPTQVELLFTSYFAVTGVMMLITGAVSSRIGPKWTLLSGLTLIITFSALAGASSSINQLVGFRAGWGVGNALFIATSLAVIVSAATGGISGAIILYESALGLGISVGPLLGGALGGISWRGPFYGVAVLMAIGFILILTLLGDVPKATRRTNIVDPLRAVAHPGLLTLAITALFYNFAFFTLLAYTPLILQLDAHQLGLVFFGSGVLLALTSVFVAPSLDRRFGTVPTMYVILACLAAIELYMAVGSHTGLIVAVIVAGAFLGINNTLVTQAVMTVSTAERPVASAGYNFVRWIGGAIAPWLAGQLAERVSPQMPFYVGSSALLLALLWLFSRRSHVPSLLRPAPVHIHMEDDSLSTIMPTGPLDAPPTSWELDVEENGDETRAG